MKPASFAGAAYPPSSQAFLPVVLPSLVDVVVVLPFCEAPLLFAVSGPYVLRHG
jgi:hypothetical protein